MREGSATDESWLDEYVDGSTSEEVIGAAAERHAAMGLDATPEEVANSHAQRAERDG